ncbi:MAG: Release factor glutamine methyltransferase [Candidatus Uhrbacteria bacterium GW2011_GWE2_40_58]|nr:MAG: Release factor glutamine methyltransferase [Candidatus Uhrbacteria bacterium GW2011_GWF2_40_263]KKR68021.1 MAG: Release factor glutamine methyltransferase [Candidatus Uhrbacteria bacterium GW2011_GWE2_40_58]OGL92944.1 MAG: protein-(glutamine-N5) methyltransferase, release factor-specific [Candidatus Uhrbacteria bacterium RIFOXYA2_FULL_40_9]OGL97082.1 MAG: protein-(glutamine-N5) methyltransferase, release factor-specific [Candidatus Uhrbacteria bacterium RIFOXYB2_FULL_41_18]HBK34610.1 pe
MTIVEALKWASEQLQTNLKETNKSPMLDAELLLSFVLKTTKTNLFAHINEPLSSEQSDQFTQLIIRRLTHEPIAYLLGTKAFYGREFEVNSSVLIPRPATELMIEQAISLCKDSPPETTFFLDVGTGSGAIAITLATETAISVIATDISKEAIEVAKRNALAHHVDQKIDFRQGDLLEPILLILEKLKKHKTDCPDQVIMDEIILCANLPYLSETQWEKTQLNVREHEPRLALEAGSEGLDYYEKLFQQIKKHRSLFPNHLTTLIEIDPSQVTRAIDLIYESFPSSYPEIYQDLEGHNRLIVTHL